MVHYQIGINGEAIAAWLSIVDELGLEPKQCQFNVWIDVDPEDMGIVEAVVRVPEGTGDRGPSKMYASVDVVRQWNDERNEEV